MTQELEVSDDQIDEFIERLQGAFAGVTYTRPVPHPRLRPAVLVAAAIALVAVVSVLPLVSGGNASTWAAEPHNLTKAQVAVAVDRCGHRPPLPLKSVNFSAYDARGRSLAVVLQGRISASDRRWIDWKNSWFTSVCIFVGVGAGDKEVVPLTYGADSDWNTHIGITDNSVSKTTRYWVAFGHARRAAVKVQLLAPGYPVVTAIVRGGRYAMWWPTGANDPFLRGRIIEIDASGRTIGTAEAWNMAPSSVITPS